VVCLCILISANLGRFAARRPGFTLAWPSPTARQGRILGARGAAPETGRGIFAKPAVGLRGAWHEEAMAFPLPVHGSSGVKASRCLCRPVRLQNWRICAHCDPQRPLTDDANIRRSEAARRVADGRSSGAAGSSSARGVITTNPAPIHGGVRGLVRAARRELGLRWVMFGCVGCGGRGGGGRCGGVV
jgi:hypothetical protein